MPRPYLLGCYSWPPSTKRAALREGATAHPRLEKSIDSIAPWQLAALYTARTISNRTKSAAGIAEIRESVASGT